MNTTWTLLFEPLGVLMFRDDRPFNLGEHGVATSVFPRPSVFRGAVRSALFEAAGADFRNKNGFGLTGAHADLLGDATRQENFTIRGPMVGRRVGDAHGEFEYVLPWPADLVANGDKTEIMSSRPQQGPHRPRCFRLDPKLDPEQCMQDPKVDLPWTTAPPDKPRGGTRWLTVSGAKKYATGNAGPLSLEEKEGTDWVYEKTFLDTEIRTGVARATETRGRSLTAADSMLYTLRTWRMDARFGFAVEIASDPGDHKHLAPLLEHLDGHLVRLGGRSGHARVRVVPQSLAPTWIRRSLNGTRSRPAKLWLWTPGLFDLQNMPEGFRGALGPALRLGGFDMRKRSPRPLRSALDRGAVLRFEHTDVTSLEQHEHREATRHEVPNNSYGYGHWIQQV